MINALKRATFLSHGDQERTSARGKVHTQQSKSIRIYLFEGIRNYEEQVQSSLLNTTSEEINCRQIARPVCGICTETILCAGS